MFTRRSESANGKGRRMTVFTTVKIAVFAPMPMASADTAVMVKLGLRRNMRNECLRSARKDSMRDLLDRVYGHAPIYLEPETVDGESVAGSFFPMFGVKPAIGRLIGPEDDRMGNTDSAEAVVSRSEEHTSELQSPCNL